jgi:hypothetical protein
MDRPLPGSALEALGAFLGDWAGTTQWEATPWGPARSAEVAISFARAAAGFAVAASYRHTEADGSRTEGHGVFTVDKDRPDALWYHVNSLGLPPEAPARASWREGTLTVERRSERGIARHTFRVDDGVLTHSAGLRLGAASEFTPFMTSVCRRASAPAAAPAATA